MSTPFSFGDDRLQATVDQCADQLSLTLRDQTSGQTWGPAPLVHLEVYDKAEFRVNTLTKYRIDLVQQQPNGFRVILGDSFRRLQFALWVRIEQGELVVTLQVGELYENKSEVYRTFSAIILPGLLRTNGQLVLPINSGILCNVAQKPKITDRFMIYGEQTRWELLPTVPLAIHGQGSDGVQTGQIHLQHLRLAGTLTEQVLRDDLAGDCQTPVRQQPYRGCRT